MQNKRLLIIMLIVSILLLIPVVAMQFTDEVNWKLMDFVVAGVLLLGAGLTIEFIFRKTKRISTRIVLLLVLVLVFLLVWAELAVGIFDTLFFGH